MTGRPAHEPELLFAEVVRRFTSDPSVTPPSAGAGGKFGASTLRVGGKIFALLSNGELVVKLPAARVDELVASGTGKRFDPGRGRVMKEWATIGPVDSSSWADLAEEARAYVAGA